MKSKKFSIRKAISWLLLIFVAFLIIFPFIWMVVTSFKTEADIRSFPPVLFSGNYSFDNYKNIWSRIPFLSYYKNTLIFAGGVTIVSLICDSMAGYAFARLHFKGRNLLFSMVLVTMMIPFQVIMVPLYSQLFHMKLLNTYLGLILPRATNAFGIFMMRQFFVTLPGGLEEAARIDGANAFQIYVRIMLPLCKPAMVTLTIFHAMYNWNSRCGIWNYYGWSSVVFAANLYCLLSCSKGICSGNCNDGNERIIVYEKNNTYNLPGQC